MLARARILLRYPIFVASRAVLTPHEYQDGKYRIRVHAPVMSSTASAGHVPGSPLRPDMIETVMVPADPQAEVDNILLGGRRTVASDLLVIDFFSETFDRRPRENPLEDGDPSGKVILETVNRWLAKMRVISRSGNLVPLDPFGVNWVLNYLTDDGQPLAVQEGLLRTFVGSGRKLGVTGMDAGAWDDSWNLPTYYDPPVWDVLHLDAVNLLPAVGPAIVLAYAALETFIAQTIDALAPSAGINPDFWKWTTNRDPWTQNPSVADQFDVLLKVVCGHSLKEDNRLWERFQEIRKARTSFVHEGKAMVGPVEVSIEKVHELIGACGEILDRIEEWMPEAMRRPRLTRPGGLEISYRIL
jgi:hypothetical protein